LGRRSPIDPDARQRVQAPVRRFDLLSGCPRAAR